MQKYELKRNNWKSSIWSRNELEIRRIVCSSPHQTKHITCRLAPVAFAGADDELFGELRFDHGHGIIIVIRFCVLSQGFVYYYFAEA